LAIEPPDRPAEPERWRPPGVPRPRQAPR
jgi:hypothetical protein